jgi:hypothetical protein
MKPSFDTLYRKQNEFDALVENIVKLRDLINSDEYFKLTPEYRSLLLSEYHTASSLKIILKSQIEYLKSSLYSTDIPNII